MTPHLTPRRERWLLFTLAGIQFTHILDFMIMMPLGPQFTQLFGISDAQFGLLVSAYTLSAGVSGLLASTYIDRFGRKRLLLVLYALFSGARTQEMVQQRTQTQFEQVIEQRLTSLAQTQVSQIQRELEAPLLIAGGLVRVNALLPGGTDTPMGQAFTDTPESLAFVQNMHALKRLAQPEEIARSALYLASDASSFTTGIALLADYLAPQARGIGTCGFHQRARLCQFQRRTSTAFETRLRQPQRLHGVAAPVDGFKRLPHLDKDRMLQGGVVGPQIGVDGSKEGLLVIGSAVALVGLSSGIKQAGILGPIIGRVGQVQPCAQKAAGSGGVTHGLGIKGRSEMLLGTVGTSHMGIGKGFGLLHDPRHLPALHEAELGQTGLGAGLCFRFGI